MPMMSITPQREFAHHSGTTLFAIAQGYCIVMGADSLAGHTDGRSERFLKLHKAGSAMVACEGMGSFYGTKNGNVLYSADTWMRDIASNVPPGADAGAIAATIQKCHPFQEIFAVEKQAYSLCEYQDRKGHLANFLVASAAPDRLAIFQVHVAIDHSLWRVIFNLITHLDQPPPIARVARVAIGRTERIEAAFVSKGNAYEELLSSSNGSIGALLNGDSVDSEALARVVLGALRLETKANPGAVGPPFLISKLKPGSVETHSFTL